MNNMSKVAEMLGVELEEEFKIIVSENVYKITSSGLFFKDHGNWYPSAITSILNGDKDIIKIPKFPKQGTGYYYVRGDGEIASSKFDKDTIFDVLNFKAGNYFLTKEEITEEDIKQIVEMLNSPERLV